MLAYPFPHLSNVIVLKLNLCYSDTLKMVPIRNLAYNCLRAICVSCGFLSHWSFIDNLWELRKITLCDMHCKYFCLCLFMMLLSCKDLFLCRQIYLVALGGLPHSNIIKTVLKNYLIQYLILQELILVQGLR